MKIVLGQLALSFYAVQAALVKEVLERLGHDVELRIGLHEVVYPELADGKIDVFVATWIPYSHSVYWERYKDRLLPLGTAFAGGESFWAVPDYLPPAEVKSVADLIKPNVLARMEKTIPSIGTGAGLTQRSFGVAAYYGLESVGYTVVPGSDQTWIDLVSSAYEQRRWFVTPLWQPQFLNKRFAFRKLEEPQLLMGGIDTGTITAHESFISRAPERTVAALKRIAIGVGAITEMDYYVNVDGLTPGAAARRWYCQNPDKLDLWVGP